MKGAERCRHTKGINMHVNVYYIHRESSESSKFCAVTQEPLKPLRLISTPSSRYRSRGRQLHWKHDT
jgi:hypothetical protein